MKAIILTVVTCCFSPFLMAAPELTGSPQELSDYLLDARKIISIQGSAEEKVEADQAIVMLTIKNEAKRLDAALEENERLQRQVKQMLSDGGIASDRIKAANFSSTPDYGWLNEKPKAYEISRGIKVTIDNAPQMRTVARAVDAIDEVFMGVMNFEDSAKTENELKTQQKALENVLAKKSMYERTLNVSLSLVKIVDQSVHPVRSIALMQNRRGVEAFSDSVAMEAEPNVPSGQFAGVTYHANVMVEFVVQ
jgi:uncharacterized protein YggE